MKISALFQTEEKIKKIFWPALAAYLLLMSVVTTAWYDEGYYVYSGWLMTVDHLIPYRQFFTPYLPYITYFFGLPQVIFGPSLLAARIIMVSFFLGAIFLTLKLFGESRLKYFYILFIIFSLPALSSYLTATPFGIIAFLNLLAVYLIHKKTYQTDSRQLIIIALSLALSLALRINSAFGALAVFSFFLLTREYRALLKTILWYGIFSLLFLVPCFILDFSSLLALTTINTTNWPVAHSLYGKISSLWYIFKDYILYGLLFSLIAVYGLTNKSARQIAENNRLELLLFLLTGFLMFGQIIFAPSYFLAYLYYSHLFLVILILLAGHKIVLRLNERKKTACWLAALAVFLLFYNLQYLYFLKNEYSFTNPTIVKLQKIKKELAGKIKKNSYGLAIASPHYGFILGLKTPPDFADPLLGFSPNKNLVGKGYYNTAELLKNLSDQKISYLILAEPRWRESIAQENQDLIPAVEKIINDKFKLIKKFDRSSTIADYEKELLFYERK